MSLIATLETAKRIECTQRPLFTIAPLPGFRQYSPFPSFSISPPSLPPGLLTFIKPPGVFFSSFLSLSLSLYIPSSLFFILPLAFFPLWCTIRPASPLPSFAQCHRVFYWYFLSNIIEFSATDALTASIIGPIQIHANFANVELNFSSVKVEKRRW